VRVSKFPEFTDPRIDISYPIILGELAPEEPTKEPEKPPPPPPPPPPPEPPPKDDGPQPPE
jgi:hypothetical protein